MGTSSTTGPSEGHGRIPRSGPFGRTRYRKPPRTARSGAAGEGAGESSWHTSWSSSSRPPRPAPSRGTSVTATSSSPRSATSATCRTTPRTPRPRSRTSRGAASAVDVDNGFTPYYVVPRDKKSHITKLKGLLKDADELYLATDEDREGEAIAWHLLDELKPKNIPVHRMVFHEITKPAIQAAVANPRDDQRRPRRGPGGAPDPRPPLRLRGQPGAVEKVMSGLSAGRVQSVATRLVVDRERERMRFRAASYWDLEGTFDAGCHARAADVPGPPALGRRRPGRPRLRLRPGRPAQEDRRHRPPRPPAAPRTSPPACGTRRTTSARWSPSPTSALPTRRSAPPPSSRRPAASSG